MRVHEGERDGGVRPPPSGVVLFQVVDSGAEGNWGVCRSTETWIWTLSLDQVTVLVFLVLSWSSLVPS